jgi:endonuclease/exonuclease/phosphatase family metal-dependent hydrolase
MKFLDLNCQKGYQSGLGKFLQTVLKQKSYDVLILQEVTDNVLSYLNDPSYECLRAFNKEINAENELCIVYRKSFILERWGFESFAALRKDPVRGFKHPCFGLLWADLKTEAGMMRVASIHAHSGTDQKVRIEEVRRTKEVLCKQTARPTIIAGDFNAGFFHEPDEIAQAFFPEFIWETKKLEPTLDSRYSENVPHLPNRIAALLSLFNIGIHLRTDHVFLDHNLALDITPSFLILPDRISDHSPIECLIDFNKKNLGK